METKQEIQVLDPIQAVRKRPGMYVGNLYQKGTMRIFTMLIEDCAFLCQTDDFFIEIAFFTLDNQLQEILLTAIIDGLALACKRYIKKQALLDYKIARKGFYDGLILVCNPQENIYKSRHSFQKSNWF